MERTGLLTRRNSYILVAALVILLYWITAIAMVFINKQLISLHDSNVDISVFIVWIQTLIGISSVILLRTVTTFLQLSVDMPVFKVKSLMNLDMILASVFFTGTLVLNNLMLKYISIAFYQLARSLTLIFVILFSITILREKISWKISASCLLIISGFYMGVDEEMFSQGLKIQGIVYGVGASLSAALCGVFYKRVQVTERPSSLQLTFNNQIISLVGLTPLLISTAQLNEFLQSPTAHNPRVALLLLLSGFSSALMGWLSASLIALTSPLTHNISIHTKSVLQTVLAVLWSGEQRSYMWWLGNALVLSGIGTYTANKISSSEWIKGSNGQANNSSTINLLMPQTGYSKDSPRQSDLSHLNGKVNQ